MHPRMFACTALIVMLSLSACDRTSSEERAAADARDVAAVEAANKRLPQQRLSPRNRSCFPTFAPHRFMTPAAHSWLKAADLAPS